MGTLPHKVLLPGGTHKGGNSMGACTQESMSTSHWPLVTGQSTTGQPATGHLPNGQEDTDRPPVTTSHRPPVTGHRPPVKWAIQTFLSQSVTGHRPSSHRSLDLERLNTGESPYSLATGHQSLVNWPLVAGHQTLYQPIISETHARGV